MRQARRDICQAELIDHAVRQLCVVRKEHSGQEERQMLNCIGVGAFLSAKPIKLLLRDLSFGHKAGAVFLHVTSGLRTNAQYLVLARISGNTHANIVIDVQLYLGKTCRQGCIAENEETNGCLREDRRSRWRRQISGSEGRKSASLGVMHNARTYTVSMVRVSQLSAVWSREEKQCRRKKLV